VKAASDFLDSLPGRQGRFCYIFSSRRKGRKKIKFSSLLFVRAPTQNNNIKILAVGENAYCSK
jgi:hypothetical protein